MVAPAMCLLEVVSLHLDFAFSGSMATAIATMTLFWPAKHEMSSNHIACADFRNAILPSRSLLSSAQTVELVLCRDVPRRIPSYHDGRQNAGVPYGVEMPMLFQFLLRSSIVDLLHNSVLHAPYATLIMMSQTCDPPNYCSNLTR